MTNTNFKRSYERPSIDILSFRHDQVLMSSNTFVSVPTDLNESFGVNGNLTEFEW